jgi:predicted ABC-class ATPase
MKTKLSEQLPEGLELVSAGVGRGVPQPRLATYLLEVRSEYVNERLKARTGALLACESLEVQRQTDHKRAKLKNVDVRGFLKSIELDDNNIEVKCKVSSAGTIRVDEILRLLELDVAKLAGPIRRTSVEWEEG